MDRAGVRKLGKIRVKVKALMGNSYTLQPKNVYSLRNHGLWSGRGPDELRAEIGRIPHDEKAASLGE